MRERGSARTTRVVAAAATAIAGVGAVADTGWWEAGVEAVRPERGAACADETRGTVRAMQWVLCSAVRCSMSGGAVRCLNDWIDEGWVGVAGQHMAKRMRRGRDAAKRHELCTCMGVNNDY